MFSVSPGVYDRIVDRSHVVSASGLLAGGIVISAKRGPVGINVVTSAREFVDTYGLPTRDNPSMYAALRFLNRAGILTVRRVINDAVSAGGVLDVSGDAALTITAASQGAWGNKVKVTLKEVENDNTLFSVVVREGGAIVENFEVSRNPEAKNGYGNNIYVEDIINNRSNYIRVADDPTVGGAVLTGAVELAGGADDTIAPTAGMIMQAWEEFENVQAIPAQLLINAGWAVPAIQQKMLDVASKRKDAVAILDIPEDVTEDVDGMIEYRKNDLGANTYFGALYGGWLTIYDQYGDREVNIPPSGDVAAVFVHTVNVAERWEAPAGLQRGIIPNAIGVSKIMTEGDRDLLYTAGINPVTTHGGASAVIWGQKTLQIAASALDRLNVVNNVLWINQRVLEALQPFVFEPNTEQVRNSINFLLSSFLENIQQRGGLYGFYVDTSDKINTPYAIDNGQMFIEYYIKPTKTAEFIQASAIITSSGVQLG